MSMIIRGVPLGDYTSLGIIRSTRRISDGGATAAKSNHTRHVFFSASKDPQWGTGMEKFISFLVRFFSNFFFSFVLFGESYITVQFRLGSGISKFLRLLVGWRQEFFDGGSDSEILSIALRILTRFVLCSLVRYFKLNFRVVSKVFSL